jgi:nucleoside-diphosphate-sugar epimerase
VTSTFANPLAEDLDRVLARTEFLWQQLRGERILITGATGFFGCWLLETFSWANRRLNLKARSVALSRRPRVLYQKAPHLKQDRSITLHAADVRSGEFPAGAFSHVIHAATEAKAKLNNEAPQQMFDTIVEGTRGALKFSAVAGVERFLLVSSGAVYGAQPQQLTHMDESYQGGPDSLNPLSAYAEGKRAAETLTVLAASPRLIVTSARCFAFVGPYMETNAHFAIGNFIADRLHNRPIRVQSDGSAERSYLYASDLMIWLWTILFKGATRRAYNIGSEETVSIASLAREVAAAIPPPVEVHLAASPSPGAPVHRYVPCTARARVELGLQAEIPLPEAIVRTYAWFAGNALQCKPMSKYTAASGGNNA